MKNLTLLKIEAQKSAEYRGHVVQWQVPTKYNNSDRKTTNARCLHCDMMMFVDSEPAPNSIDISGEMVALTCPVS